MTTEIITPAPEPTEAERQQSAIDAANAHRAAATANDTPPDAIVPDGPTKPEHVPDKFWNAETGAVNYEAWNAAHTDLETKFHQSKGDQQDDSQAGDDAGSQDAADGTPAQNTAVANAQAEWAEKGELSDGTYTKLEAAGMNRATVDSYIAGIQAQSDSLTQAAHGVTEGEENFTKMIEWAGETLSEAEVKAFNLQVSSNDAGVITSAVTGLYGKYKEGATVEGDRVGGLVPNVNSSLFSSKAEMTAAMNAPNPNSPGKTLYETDSAFRAEVQKKIQNSRRAGINIFL